MWTNMEEASVAHWGIASIWVKGLFASLCHLFPCMWCLLSLIRHRVLRWTWSLVVRLVGLLEYTMCLCGHVHSGQWVFFCMCENVWMCAWNVQLPKLTELKPTLACQEKGTKPHTHRICLFPLSHTPYLSNSVSSNSFLSQTVYTHIHKHTCSPHPAKRERWLVNKQWHSAHSVTRLSFDQHRCSCSPQQCFLSFCLRMLPCTHTHTHL